MRQNSSSTRFSREELRVAVAQALLHLGDITWLADSPLAHLPPVQRRCEGKHELFAEGQALHDVLDEIVRSLVERLSGNGKVAILRATLQGVASDRSVSRIARDLGKTREHFSRTYWKLAAGLVAEEVLALNGAGSVRYNTGRVRKPSP